MIIRPHFSFNFNEHVAQNYKRMLERPLEIRYFVIRGFLDRQQYALLDECKSQSFHYSNWLVLIDQIYWLTDARLSLLTAKFIQYHGDFPELLTDMIKRKADDSYVSHGWDSIQSMPEDHSIAKNCCLESLAVLKRLVFETNIYVDDFPRMLSTLSGF